MVEGNNLDKLKSLAKGTADRVSILMDKATFSVPCLTEGISDANGTNSLNEDYLADLVSGKHLEKKHLDSYYSNLAKA